MAAVLVASLLISSVLASPAVQPNVVAEAHPEITPFRVANTPSRTALIHQRDLASDLQSLGGGLASRLSSAVGDVNSFFVSGVPAFFTNLPTGNAVESSLGINDAQLAALPTQVLNLPPYGNWTGSNWNIRFRGNVYKQPNTSLETLNRLANIFLVNTDISQLPPSEQDQARNLTAEIFVVQQNNQTVQMHLEPAPAAGASGEPGGGGAVTASGGFQNLTLPYPTTEEGDFDVFLPIQANGLTPGDQATQIQRLNVYAQGSNLGNATAYLVPPNGLSVISDIDDILRVTRIYDPADGLLNTFARPFVQWENMPSIYANWSRSIPGIHFHYLTTTPEQVTRNYMDFIYKTYPGGSFDTRPLNFSNIPATLSIRKFLLTKVFETFPQRKFVLVADTSNSDVMRDYPSLAHTYPSQVACIFLRNTSATDSDKLPYNTAGFKGLNQSQYMFFVHPDDLTNLDIVGGNCYNKSIPQNVTFGYQDELLGYHGSSSGSDKLQPPVILKWLTERTPRWLMFGQSTLAIVAFMFAFGSL